MSTETLTGLRDYLYGTLSRNNMLWLATQLTEYANKEFLPTKRYTMGEINAMLDEAERDFEEGRGIPSEEVFRELEEEFEEEEQLQLKAV